LEPGEAAKQEEEQKSPQGHVPSSDPEGGARRRFRPKLFPSLFALFFFGNYL